MQRVKSKYCQKVFRTSDEKNRKIKVLPGDFQNTQARKKKDGQNNVGRLPELLARKDGR
jgi:hypothetical protein